MGKQMNQGFRPFQMHREHPRRFGGMFYFWLLSMLMLVAISLLFSNLIRNRATELLREERMRAETSLVETMTMVCDRESSAISQYAARVAEDENVRAFLSAAGMESAEDKMLLKQVFDAVHVESNRPACATGLYLFSLKNGYLISASEGSNAFNSPIFDYEKHFGCSREAFLEKIRNLRATMFFLPNSEGGKRIEQIYYLRVVVGRGSAQPLGYVMIPYRFPAEALSSEDGVICGLLLQDGNIWDIQDQVFLSQEENHSLVKASAAGFVQFREEDYLVTRQRSSLQNWEYLRVVQSDLFFGRLRGYQQFAVFCLTGCLIVCFALALILTRRNYHPVLQLVENLRKTEGRKPIGDINFQWIEERYQGLQASHDRLSGMLDQEKKLIVNNLFCRLLKGYYHSDYEVENVFAPYLIEFTLPCFRLILWSVEEDFGLLQQDGVSVKGNAIDLLHRMTAETAEEYTKRISEKVWSVDCDGMVFLLCNYDLAAGRLETDFERNHEEIRQILKEKTGVSYSWFQSAECDSLSDVPKAYMTCIELMRRWNMGELHEAADEPRITPNGAGEQMENGGLPEAVMEYVHIHLYEPNLSLTRIGTEFSVSESYLSRLIRREYDIQLMSYVNAKRIERAAWLLEHTDLTLTAIAQETGFSSYRTLLRVFGQYHSVTPTQYRKEKRKQTAGEDIAKP